MTPDKHNRPVPDGERNIQVDQEVVGNAGKVSFEQPSEALPNPVEVEGMNESIVRLYRKQKGRQE